MESILLKIKSIVKIHLNCSLLSIHHNLRDVHHMDEFDFIEIMDEIESDFNILINIDKNKNIKTVADIALIVKNTINYPPIDTSIISEYQNSVY